MQYQKLGNSELFISEISFGCMSLGKDHAENAKIIHRSIDLGINFLDTADLYDKGLNEKSVGKAIKSKRQKVILATKVGNQWRSDGSGWDWNPRKTYILKAVKESLRRLNTDYIDLYQLHGGTLEDPFDECVEAFELLKEEGLIRAYGISSIRPTVIKKWATKTNISSVMTQYSLLDRRPEEFSLSFIQDQNVGVLVRGALAKGLLGGKPATQYLEYLPEEVETVQIALKALTLPTRRTAQSAIRYCLDHTAVTSVVSGASSIKQIQENIESSDSPPLSLLERIDLQASIRPLLYKKHRV